MIENLNAGQLFAEVSIVFFSRGAPKTLTRRAHFLVLLLLLPRLVFRESYTQECRGDRQREPGRRYISCFVTITGCGQPMFNRYRRKNLFRENLSTLGSFASVCTIRSFSFYRSNHSNHFFPPLNAEEHPSIWPSAGAEK